MKRTFLRILPLAVAVLLATSCSKDDNNTNEVVNNGQETVQTKTLPISITVNQKGLSKLSSANVTGEALQPIFETSDKLAIYNVETFLTELAIKEGSISQDGKSATFEGEITAEGIVDGTELTAKIGTPLTTDAITATSREDAVRQGCYQISAPFVYSKDGNFIALEEQNAYIEVVWTNKEGQSVDFTINDSKTVSLQLNDKGQGWIVVPAGTKFTCAALGLTNATTTAAANIYGINRAFSAEPVYVDLGLPSGNLWAAENYSSGDKTTFTYEEARAIDGIPEKEDFVELYNQCLWVWDATNNGYNVFKSKDANDKQTTKGSSSEVTYDVSTDPHIFLPVASSSAYFAYFWSRTPLDESRDKAYSLFFNSSSVNPQRTSYGVGSSCFVRLVWRSN